MINCLTWLTVLLNKKKSTSCSTKRRNYLVHATNWYVHWMQIYITWARKKKFTLQGGVSSKEESWCRYNPHSHKHSLLTHHFLLCTQPHPCYTQLFPASYHYQTAVNHCNSRRLISYTRERERERECSPHWQKSLQSPQAIHWCLLSLEQQISNSKWKPKWVRKPVLKISLYLLWTL